MKAISVTVLALMLASCAAAQVQPTEREDKMLQKMAADARSVPPKEPLRGPRLWSESATAENEALLKIDEECRKGIRKLPAIGMTKQQVLSKPCWGDTVSINTMRTANGVTEQVVWHKGIKGYYVYLTDGIVTAIQY